MCVLLQAHGVAERFAADVTGEGPGPAVGAADVHFKPMRGGEHLGAGGQSVGLLWAAEGGWLGPCGHPTSAPGCRLASAWSRRSTGLPILLAFAVCPGKVLFPPCL